MTAYGNYKFFVDNDFKEYSGKWVAILDESVVASGDNAKEVVSVFKKKYPNKTPFLTKIRRKLSIL